MLNSIKEIINKKQNFLEAASIIFEDTTNSLDGLIVLDEADNEEFTEGASKKYKDAKFADLPEDLKKNLKSVSKLIVDIAKELFQSDKYKSLANNDWAKKSFAKFCKGPTPDGEVGMVRVHKSGDCMIQITGHFANENKTQEEKLIHNFIAEVYKKAKNEAQKQFDIRLDDEGSEKNFEGFDAYPSIKIGKDVYASIDESKETNVNKPKELKESFYIGEESEDGKQDEVIEDTENELPEDDELEEEPPKDSEDALDTAIDNKTEEEPIEPENSEDDLIDDTIDGPSESEDNKTDEELDDLLTVTIDIKSNTITDVLPVPPDNATEVLPDEEDDTLNTRVDSGFDDEDKEDIPSEESEEDNPLDSVIEDDKEEPVSETEEDLDLEESFDMKYFENLFEAFTESESNSSESDSTDTKSGEKKKNIFKKIWEGFLKLLKIIQKKISKFIAGLSNESITISPDTDDKKLLIYYAKHPGTFRKNMIKYFDVVLNSKDKSGSQMVKDFEQYGKEMGYLTDEINKINSDTKVTKKELIKLQEETGKLITDTEDFINKVENMENNAEDFTKIILTGVKIGMNALLESLRTLSSTISDLLKNEFNKKKESKKSNGSEVKESSESLIDLPLERDDTSLPPKPSDNSKENLNKVDDASHKKHIDDLEKEWTSKNSVVKESEDILFEDISLDGTAPAEAAPAPATDAPAEAPTDGSTPPDANQVTNAVLDKVGESEPDPESADGGTGLDGEAVTPQSKEELMKKLSNITKNLEDAKTAIMKSI